MILPYRWFDVTKAELIYLNFKWFNCSLNDTTKIKGPQCIYNTLIGLSERIAQPTVTMGHIKLGLFHYKIIFLDVADQ